MVLIGRNADIKFSTILRNIDIINNELLYYTMLKIFTKLKYDF